MLKKIISKKIRFFRSHHIKLAFARLLCICRTLNGSRDRVTPQSTILDPLTNGTKLSVGMIDHSYHQITNSSSFFAQILRQIGKVEIIWDSKWNGGRFPGKELLAREDFDLVVAFQSFYYHSPTKLRKLARRNTIIVPMYDDAFNLPDKLFLKYKEFRFVNFSKTLHERLENMGIRSLYCRYFPDPDAEPTLPLERKGLHGFFWQRTNDITWTHIKQLIAGTEFNSFHIHLALDPIWYREVLPSEHEMTRYNITISRWFERKAEFLSVMSKANVIFTPRLYEGIGMPVLESMSMGKVVVAPDHPTMNEYIHHGSNGLLYDPRVLEPLDFSNVSEIGRRAFSSSLNYYSDWMKQKDELIKWMKSD